MAIASYIPYKTQEGQVVSTQEAWDVDLAVLDAIEGTSPLRSDGIGSDEVAVSHVISLALPGTEISVEPICSEGSNSDRWTLKPMNPGDDTDVSLAYKGVLSVLSELAELDLNIFSEPDSRTVARLQRIASSILSQQP